MDTNKITFLCVIFLFVMILSNYMSVEGFKSKKSKKSKKSNTVTRKELNKMMRVVKSLNKNMNNTASNIRKTASNVNKSESDVKSMNANVKSIMDKINTSSKNVESTIDKANVKTSEYTTTIDKSVDSNKKISEDIDKKMIQIADRAKQVKTQSDRADEIKNHVDKVLDEFQKSSKLILAQMKLISDNNEAKQLNLTANRQGFQNMDAVKPNTKSDAITTVNMAYDGKMNLEGFSTTTDSAYLSNPDLFTLEQNVISSLKIFNEKYYGYQMCLRKNEYANGSCLITSGTDIGLNEVTSSKEVVISSINTFNDAIVAMNASSKKISQTEFQSRHNQIKETATRVSSLRAELDMKMANMLDKKKGPLSEAQNKYNTENYVAIGWTILATSLIYYVFVEME